MRQQVSDKFGSLHRYSNCSTGTLDVASLCCAVLCCVMRVCGLHRRSHRSLLWPQCESIVSSFVGRWHGARSIVKCTITERRIDQVKQKRIKPAQWWVARWRASKSRRWGIHVASDCWIWISNQNQLHVIVPLHTCRELQFIDIIRGSRHTEMICEWKMKQKDEIASEIGLYSTLM